MNVVSIDPGKVCGFAWWQSCKPLEALQSWERDQWVVINYAAHLIENGAAELVVCESFVPRPGIRSWQPDALETIGALRFLCRRAGVPFETQSPADAKRFAGPRYEKLRKLGWHNPTPGNHANDASAHLLLAAVRHGLIDPARFAA